MKNAFLATSRFLYRSNIWIAANLCCLGIFVSLLLKGTFDWIASLSLFILSWQVYVGDRFLIHPEDSQQTELALDNSRFVRRHRKVFAVGLILSAVAQIALSSAKPMILPALAINAILSLAYIVNIPLLNRRAKTIPYIKAFYVSATYLITTVCYAFVIPSGYKQWGILSLLLLLCAGNIAAFDIKDRDNDRKAGIKTFATLLHPKQLISLETIIAVVFGASLFWSTNDAFIRSLSFSFFAYALLLSRLFFVFSIDYLFIVIDGALSLPLIFYGLGEVFDEILKQVSPQ